MRGGGRAAVRHVVHTDRAPPDYDGLQRSRLLAVRQPGIRLRQPLDPRAHLRLPAGSQRLPAAVSVDAQLRLVDGGRSARRVVVRRAQSDDVSVLRVAGSDDVASLA